MWSIWLQTILEQNWQCTWRHRLNEARHALVGNLGRNICFPQPSFICLVGRPQGAYQNTGITLMDSVTGGIYLGNYRAHRHHLIVRNTVYVSQLLVAYTPANLSLVHTICGIAHSLSTGLHSRTQFGQLLTAMYPSRCSHARLMFLLPEPLFRTNNLQVY